MSTKKTLTITWEDLFPYGILSKIVSSLQNNHPDVYNVLLAEIIATNDTDYLNHKIFLRWMIPDDYRRYNNGLDITECAKSDFSKYWNKGEQYKRYDATIDSILKAAVWNTYKTLDFNTDIKNRTTEMLSWLSSEDYISYESYVNDTVLPLLSNASGLTEIGYPDVFKDKTIYPDFPSILCSLIAIVSTLDAWYQRPKNKTLYASHKILADILLPSKSNYRNDSSWTHKRKEEEEKNAHELLLSAAEEYEKKHYDQCAKSCLEIIQKNFVADLTIGEAYYLLAMCYKEINCQNINEIILALEKAVDYGFQKAYEELLLYNTINKQKKEALYNEPMTALSAQDYLIFNTYNTRVEMILKTLPTTLWNESEYKEHIIYQVKNTTLRNVIASGSASLFFLLDDDYMKNFHDFLTVLNHIKSIGKHSSSNIAIYIRTNEEQYASLIDTSLKLINEENIVLFTIDDDKWPAQHLLFNHPLFYPIHTLRNIDLDHRMPNKYTTINYTVVSESNDNLTNWLIREAFWLSTLWYKKVHFNISIVSPEYEQISSRLRYECPGIFSDVSTSEVSSVQIRTPTTEIDNLQSPKLLTELSKICSEPHGAFNYIVINTAKDITSMNLAIKIREQSIRQLIQSNTKPNRSTLPIIAFHCPDSDIAKIATKLCVQTIDQGSAWYNNYNIIPFGMLGERYTFDSIDGGYLEHLAQATHLQYSGLDSTANCKDIQTALQNYFKRTYNRDSSMAVALSLPYRLFQTNPYDSNSNHILPLDRWNITDSPYTKTLLSGSLAEKFKESLPEGENFTNLVRFEHSRWLRWMISRGWISATPEQNEIYLKAGNPKHQLYIARMHGCICSFDELDCLSEYLFNCATEKNWKQYADGSSFINRKKKDFKIIDESNINMTTEILQTTWFEKDTKKENIKHEER